MPESEVQTDVMTDQDIDTAYDELLGDNPPVDSEQVAKPVQQEKPQEIAQSMLKFTVKGKEIQAPMNDPRITQWLQQGYDYSEISSALKKEQQQFQTQKTQIEELQKQYGPIDEWVKQNPQVWQKFLQTYEQNKQGLTGEIDPNNPLAQTVQALQQELNQLKEPVQQVISERTREMNEAQEKALDAEIESVGKQFGLDLRTPEADGRSKEFKVYEHAAKIGTKSFKAAFLSLYHEDIIKSERAKALEGVTKERQKQTKLGLLGKSPAPSKGLSAAKDYKNKTYEQLMQEGLDELNAG